MDLLFFANITHHIMKKTEYYFYYMEVVTMYNFKRFLYRVYHAIEMAMLVILLVLAFCCYNAPMV